MAGIANLPIIDGAGDNQNLKVYDTEDGYVPYHAVSGSVTVKQEQGSTIGLTVNSTPTSATTIALSANRKCLVIFNNTNKKVYITLGANVPSLTSFSYILESGGTYESTAVNAAVEHRYIAEADAVGSVAVTSTT